METKAFKNRTEAGKYLATYLQDYAGRDDLVVLGLPRGGVPVAYEVARSLDAPLDVMVVRKLGVPNRQELALGAVATGDTRVINEHIRAMLDVDERTIERIASKERYELEQQEVLYRAGRQALDLTGKTVILVDDGLATGATMWAAVVAAKQHGAAKIIVAVPTAPAQVCDDLRGIADEVVCTITPDDFGGVGRWYAEFSQVSDEEVQALLNNSQP